MSNDEKLEQAAADDQIIDQQEAGTAEDLQHNQPADESSMADAETSADAESSSEHEVEDEQEESLQQQVADLKQQIEHQKTDVLKAYAELENFKKRNQQEVDNYKKYALEKFILELLPIQDGFERAAQLKAQEEAKPDDIIEGFSLIQKQIEGLFEKFHVKRIAAKEQPFDPNMHQAISQVEQSDVASNTVIEEAQAGYTLNERVIRPSLVVVAK